MTAKSWLEEIWEEREETIYPSMFGPMRGIFPLSHERFAKLGAPPDPRWLTIGVFESAPNEKHAGWLYVTSGLSNPWEDESDPNEYAGYCCELAIECARQSESAILLLHHLASVQLLALSERINAEPIRVRDRVAIHGPIDGSASILRNVLIAEPVSFAPQLRQRCGIADWLFCVGISDDEKAFGRERGHDELLRRLREGGAFPITDASRASVPL